MRCISVYRSHEQLFPKTGNGWLVRYDVKGNGKHFGVNFVVELGEEKNSKRMSRLRKEAIVILKKKMKEEKIRQIDLVSLPVPAGYKHPSWL